MSQNVLQRIDPVILRLHKTLKKLHLVRNFISRLPNGFGVLSLDKLKLSGNRLESLEDDCFLPNMIKAKTWINSNNMLELPLCVQDILDTSSLKIEMNPLRSPPMELLTEGMDVIIDYCLLQLQRLKDVHILLCKSKFIVDRSNVRPYAHGTLIGGTGFLAPDDLKSFDDSLDRHVNGTYYSKSSTLESMVEKITSLRY